MERTITLQCAGNRRRDMSGYKSLKGTPWLSGERHLCSGGSNTTEQTVPLSCSISLILGALSTATFTGVPLADVLGSCGVKEVDADDWVCSIRQIMVWSDPFDLLHWSISSSPPPCKQKCSTYISWDWIKVSTTSITAPQSL